VQSPRFPHTLHGVQRPTATHCPPPDRQAGSEVFVAAFAEQHVPLVVEEEDKRSSGFHSTSIMRVHGTTQTWYHTRIMKIAYISVSYSNRKHLSQEIEVIKRTLTASDFQPFVFVDEYSFAAQKETEMMKQATNDISKSSVLVAEMTEKAVGVGLEVGYAAALGIPVLYLKREGAEYSKTVGGLSTAVISYADANDLATRMEHFLQSLINHA